MVVVALFNVAATVYSDYSSNAVMKSINGMMATTTTVIRDGQTTQVSTLEVVPGDLVVLSLGEKVPADLRLVSVHGLRVDQSILTGESEPVSLRVKQTSDNYLESKNITFCGASVVEGSGVGLVVATGSQTMMGSIAIKYVYSCLLAYIGRKITPANDLSLKKSRFLSRPELPSPSPRIPTSRLRFVVSSSSLEFFVVLSVRLASYCRFEMPLESWKFWLRNTFLSKALFFCCFPSRIVFILFC